MDNQGYLPITSTTGTSFEDPVWVLKGSKEARLQATQTQQAMAKQDVKKHLKRCNL